MLDVLVEVLSGEFFLNSRPNGGTAVLLRSLWVTCLICLLALPLKCYLAKDTVLQFSFGQLKIELGEMLPWFGAIFAGAYAAFYSRFAAQWNYLASLYNQLMATSVGLNREQCDEEGLANWYAAFIEDAQDLHLAGKSMFKSVIVNLLQDGDMVRAFLCSMPDGPTRLARLEKSLGFRATTPSNPEVKSCAGLLRLGI
jgi:hypothetical protein